MQTAVRFLLVFGLSVAGVSEYLIRAINELKAVIRQELAAITPNNERQSDVKRHK